MDLTAHLGLSRRNSGLRTASCSISELMTARPVTIEQTFRPWLIARDPEALQNLRPAPATSSLRGAETHPLATLFEFDSWEQFRRAYDLLPPRSSGVYQINSPVSQFLMRTGVTLFKEMSFEDLRRLQLDIETLSLNPRDDDGAIVMIALKQGDHEELLFLETDERDLLLRFSEAIQRLDPDVIEGHNIFNFDLPYLVERARRWQVPLRLGRDGSPPLLNEQQRFRAGPVSLPYTQVHVHGRHIVDTYQQLQRYDTAGRSFELCIEIRDSSARSRARRTRIRCRRGDRHPLAQWRTRP